MDYRRIDNKLREAWFAYKRNPEVALGKPNVVSFVAGWNACLEQQKQELNTKPRNKGRTNDSDKNIS